MEPHVSFLGEVSASETDGSKWLLLILEYIDQCKKWYISKQLIPRPISAPGSAHDWNQKEFVWNFDYPLGWQKWKVAAGLLLICLDLAWAVAPSTECVCLILPTLCLFPLNQPSSCSRLKSKPSVPQCLPSGTCGAHHHRADMSRGSPPCRGRKHEAIFIHSHWIAVHSLSWAFCPSLSPPNPHIWMHHSQKPLESYPCPPQELSAPPIARVSTSQKTIYPFGLPYMYSLGEDNAFPANLNCPHCINIT